MKQDGLFSTSRKGFRDYSETVKVIQSCPTLQPHGLFSPWNSSGQNTGVGSLSFLQWIFPSPGNEPGSPLKVDSLPTELFFTNYIFQILKDDPVQVLHSICQQIWKTQQWPQDRKRSVFIPITKKGNVKECPNYCTIALISPASKVMLKILQAKFQQYVNCHFQMSLEEKLWPSSTAY